MTQLLPLISPASGMAAPGERFQRLVRIGWILWSVWVGLLTIVFTPFLLKHLLVRATASVHFCRRSGGSTDPSPNWRSLARAMLLPKATVRASRFDS